MLPVINPPIGIVGGGDASVFGLSLPFATGKAMVLTWRPATSLLTIVSTGYCWEWLLLLSGFSIWVIGSRSPDVLLGWLPTIAGTIACFVWDVTTPDAARFNPGFCPSVLIGAVNPVPCQTASIVIVPDLALCYSCTRSRTTGCTLWYRTLAAESNSPFC